LKKVAKELGEDLTDDELDKMFVKADLDDDGFVSSDDFYNILTHKVYWDK
jgi:Ca2+-binding EF-hand superfamily protein